MRFDCMGTLILTFFTKKNEVAIRAYYHRKYRKKKHMFIKNDYAFFTQIVVFCFVHIC